MLDLVKIIIAILFVGLCIWASGGCYDIMEKEGKIGEKEGSKDE